MQGSDLCLSCDEIAAGPHQQAFQPFGLGDAVVAPLRAAGLNASQLAREHRVFLGQRAQRTLVGALCGVGPGVGAHRDQCEILPMLGALRRRAHAQQAPRRMFREAAGHVGRLTVGQGMDPV